VFCALACKKFFWLNTALFGTQIASRAPSFAGQTRLKRKILTKSPEGSVSFGFYSVEVIDFIALPLYNANAMQYIFWK